MDWKIWWFSRKNKRLLPCYKTCTTTSCWFFKTIFDKEKQDELERQRIEQEKLEAERKAREEAREKERLEKQKLKNSPEYKKKRAIYER